MTIETTKNRPVDTLRALGGVKATIWGNATENGGIRYNVEFSRTYRDRDGNYRDTGSFDGPDALQIARLSEKAYERISELVAESRSLAGGAEQ